MAYPSIPITDKQFKYTPACNTDVRETWRKAGWPFPSAGQIKKKPNDLESVELKAKRNEEKRQAEEARKQAGDALF